MLDSCYLYNLKLNFCSLLQGLWSPKLDRYNSWKRCLGDTPPQELVMSSRWGHVTLKNAYSIAHLSVWVFEIKVFFKVRWPSSDDGKECPSCSPFQRYACCPIFDWNLSRMTIPSILLSKTYVSIRHRFVPLFFQILQYLYHVCQ